MCKSRPSFSNIFFIKIKFLCSKELLCVKVFCTTTHVWHKPFIAAKPKPEHCWVACVHWLSDKVEEDSRPTPCGCRPQGVGRPTTILCLFVVGHYIGLQSTSSIEHCLQLWRRPVSMDPCGWHVEISCCQLVKVGVNCSLGSVFMQVLPSGKVYGSSR